VEIAAGTLRFVGIVVALKAGFGLIGLAAIQLGASGFTVCAMYVFSRRLYPELHIALNRYGRRHLKTIFSFSLSVLLLQASGMLVLYTDSVVIGAFLPVSMITLFAIAANLVEAARAPVTGISHTVTPWVSSLQAREEHQELQRVVLDAGRIATLVVLPIIGTFVLRGNTFIGLWMGPSYADASGHVLQILSLALSFAVGYQIVVATMMGMSKHNGLVVAFVVEALFNLVLSTIWVTRYGIVGVAWGTAVPRVIASVIFAPWYLRRVLGIPITSFWSAVWIRPAAAMILFAVGSYLVELWRPPPASLFVYFVQVAAVLPLAGAGAWAVGLSAREKRAVLSRLSLASPQDRVEA
jgi:O-antigen/teichoic acid export membrane protein